jgi:hypothetical protein
VGRCGLLGLLYLAAVPQQGHGLSASTLAMKMPEPKTATATSPITISEQHEALATVAHARPKMPARQTLAVSERYESSRNMPSIAARSEGDTEVPGNP